MAGISYDGLPTHRKP